MDLALIARAREQVNALPKSTLVTMRRLIDTFDLVLVRDLIAEFVNPLVFGGSLGSNTNTSSAQERQRNAFRGRSPEAG